MLKAGDEIKSLARFTSTQRTAFRKLLKKYKKWTGSTQLEDRFREEVLDDPKSFTKLDLGSLLDDYSVTLQEIRTLYETKIQGGPARKPQQDPSPRAGSSVGSSVLPRLQSAVESGSKVEFDTAIATIPLGENGTFASYFVHPENVVELQVLLLQHARYYVSRSRSNSVVSPGSRSPDTESLNACPTGTDYSTLVADDAERFAKEQNSLTIDDREYRTGSTPQKAKLCARWNGDEEAMVVLRSTSGKSEQASIKKKHVKAVFDRGALIKPGKAAASPDAEPLVEGVRREVEKDRNLEPLYTFSSCRSRFVGNDNDQQKMVLATFDTGVTIHKAGRSSAEIDKSSFPFAVLLVRQESAVAGDLLAALDQSHLVRRSLQLTFQTKLTFTRSSVSVASRWSITQFGRPASPPTSLHLSGSRCYRATSASCLHQLSNWNVQAAPRSEHRSPEAPSTVSLLIARPPLRRPEAIPPLSQKSSKRRSYGPFGRNDGELTHKSLLHSSSSRSTGASMTTRKTARTPAMPMYFSSTRMRNPRSTDSSTS